MSKSIIDPIIKAIDEYADKAYDMGVKAERERIIGVILASELGDYDAGFLIEGIMGENE